jgi:hypothetical protein
LCRYGVEREQDIIAYPQVLWGAAACLRTLHAPLYARAARLCSVMALAWPLDDPTGAAEDILKVAAPIPIGAVYPAGAKPVVAAAVQAAEEAWRSGLGLGGSSNGSNGDGVIVGFASVWKPPPGMPEPAMSLPDLVPLLLKGLVRGESAAHAARALTAVAPAVGVGGSWGGRRALALAAAGLLPLVLAAAAAAEEEREREREDPGSVMAAESAAAAAMVGAAGGASPGMAAATPASAAAAMAALPGTPFYAQHTPASTSHHASSSYTPVVAMAAQARERARSGPLGVGEGAAAGRWLAAGLRAAAIGRGEGGCVLCLLDIHGCMRVLSAAYCTRKLSRNVFSPNNVKRVSFVAATLRGGGANDVLAATLESILPSPRARTAVPYGRKYAAIPPPPPPLPPQPPAPPPGAPRVGRLAEILADSLAGFLFPDHAVPVVRVLVDIAASHGGGGGGGGDVSNSDGGGGGGSAAAAAAALAMLSSLVSRARGTAASALFAAAAADAGVGGVGGGGGMGPSSPPVVFLFTPIASLLDGPHSAAALELLQRVAAASAAAAASAETSKRGGGGGGAAQAGVGVWVLDWGRIARLGSPSQMWDSVEANGGRAVDLMYGVMLSGRLDPNQAALPACLVGDSIDQ